MSNGDTQTIVKTQSVSKISFPPPHDELSQPLFDLFSSINTNGDGFLSRKEVDVALGRSDITGVPAASIATLKKMFGDFKMLHVDLVTGAKGASRELDGITLADLTEYDRLAEDLRLKRALSDGARKSLTMIHANFAVAKNKISSSSKTLFVGEPDPLKVKQGLIGDCWFLAAIVGIGNDPLRGPNEIKSWIAPNGDKFDVKFRGAKKSISVEKPTDAEIAIFSVANGMWLPVLEKAYGASVNRDALFFVDTSVTDAADGGALLSTGVSLITGHDVDSDLLSVTFQSTTKEKLARAFLTTGRKRIVTAGIRSGILADNLDNGLPMGHAYTVLSFNLRNPPTLRIRNPWGHTGIKGVTVIDGAFDMSLDDFDKNFTDIAYEELS